MCTATLTERPAFQFIGIYHTR
jgi:hypothetical protein